MKIIVSDKHVNPIKCEFCGKFISYSEIGKSVRKLNDTYLSGFAHMKCILARIDYISKTRKEIANERQD